MSKGKSFGGKIIIAAACAATLAQLPIAQVNAFSSGLAPLQEQTLEISGTDYLNSSVLAADGYLYVAGGGEVYSTTDQAVIAKYNPATSEVVWKKTYSTETDSYIQKIVETDNGNILAIVKIRNGGNYSTRLVEFDPTGEVIIESDTPNNLIDIIQAGNYTFVGVANTDSFYIYARQQQQDQSYAYTLKNASNMQDGTPIHAIEPDGNGGFIALGYDETENASYIYMAATATASPTKTVLKIRGAQLSNITIDNDGNYIIAGNEGSQLAIFKVAPDGTTLKEKRLSGDGNSSVLTDVKILENGEIIAVGSTDSAHGQVEGLHDNNSNLSNDGVIARFDNNLNLIEARAYGGSGDDRISSITTNGKKFFTTTNSKSNDNGVTHLGNEYYGIISFFGNVTSADVTFNISDVPDGIDTPDDGEYHWDDDGNSDLPTPDNTDDEIFSGWYTDEDLTDELGDDIPDDDLDLYGKYFEVEHDYLDENFDKYCTGTSDKVTCTNPDEHKLASGETSDPNTPQVPSNINTDGLTGKWVSDDKSVATVDQDGKVTGQSEGTTKIRFVLVDTNGNVRYEYVLSYTITAAKNPNTAELAPLAVALATISITGFAYITLKKFARR